MREKFREWLQMELSAVCPQCYLEDNPLDDPVYPHLVYETSASDLDTQEPFVVDVYLTDNCRDDTRDLEAIVDLLKEKFNRNIFIATDFMVQVEYRFARNLPSIAPTLKRRWVQIYCKVDWRQHV